MIVTLPLHGIPVLGQAGGRLDGQKDGWLDLAVTLQIAWVILNGWIYAWELEQEFFVLSAPQY